MPKTRFEYAQGQAPIIAQQNQLSIATEPKVIVSSGSARAQDIATGFPMDTVVEYAAETHGYHPDELRSLGIRFTDTGYNGLAYTEPQVSGDSVYYPFIDVKIGDKTPKNILNFRLRHELHHPFQKIIYSLYNREHAELIMRTSGVLAITGYALGRAFDPSFMVPSENELSVIFYDVATFAIGAFAGASITRGKEVAWLLAPSENAANMCAIRNSRFNPIK